MSSTLKDLARSVSKRCCICQATVEVVLPAVFDEIRYRLTEGDYKFLGIESFGIFGTVDIPERQYHYVKDGPGKVRTIEAKRKIRFAPSGNMLREINAERFDPTRESFKHHPDDPGLRNLRDLKYQKALNYDPKKGAWGKPVYKEKL